MKKYFKPVCMLKFIDDADIITASIEFDEGEGLGISIIDLSDPVS